MKNKHFLYDGTFHFPIRPHVKGRSEKERKGRSDMGVQNGRFSVRWEYTEAHKGLGGRSLQEQLPFWGRLIRTRATAAPNRGAPTTDQHHETCSSGTGRRAALCRFGEDEEHFCWEQSVSLVLPKKHL